MALKKPSSAYTLENINPSDIGKITDNLGLDPNKQYTVTIQEIKRPTREELQASLDRIDAMPQGDTNLSEYIKQIHKEFKEDFDLR